MRGHTWKRSTDQERLFGNTGFEVLEGNFKRKSYKIKVVFKNHNRVYRATRKTFKEG